MSVIAFVIRKNLGTSQYYTASVKPFVDISYGLSILGYNSILLLHTMEEHLRAKIEEVTKNNVRIVVFDDQSLAKQLNEIKADFVVVDDNLEIMKSLKKMELDKIKKVVYVQYLYGVNSNRLLLRKRRLKLRLASLVPWPLLTYFYRRLLASFDFVISNSNVCGYVLDKFYDVRYSGVVYPPVGVDMRPLMETKKVKVKNGEILVFLGNLRNDFFLRDLKKEIYKLKNELNLDIVLFASDKETADYFSNLGFRVLYHVPVEDIVSMLSSATATYVPTTFELFGYVGAESLLCGTPVILDTYHPFLEQISNDSKSVRLSDLNRSIADELTSIINNYPDITKAQKEVCLRYSPEESAKSLIKILSLHP